MYLCGEGGMEVRGVPVWGGRDGGEGVPVWGGRDGGEGCTCVGREGWR